MLFVRTPSAVIIEKKLGKTLSKAVSTRVPVTSGITASTAEPILWRQRAHLHIENNCPKVK